LSTTFQTKNLDDFYHAFWKKFGAQQFIRKLKYNISERLLISKS
jgi:hypothetical protein